MILVADRHVQINTPLVDSGCNEGDAINSIPPPQKPNYTPAIVPPSSLGNIATAIGIVHSIYEALSDSTGSPVKYMCLIMELRSFEACLRVIDDVLQTTPVASSIRQAIEVEATSCLNLLRNFWRRIERYDMALSGRWTLIWRKVTWAIWRASEVKNFRHQLSRHKQNIVLFFKRVTNVSLV